MLIVLFKVIVSCKFISIVRQLKLTLEIQRGTGSIKVSLVEKI